MLPSDAGRSLWGWEVNDRAGDVVSWGSRLWYVGRVWSSGDLRLEDYHEPVGRAWTEVVVFHEAVALVRTKPVTWLHRPENHSKSTFYSASRGDFGPNAAPIFTGE